MNWKQIESELITAILEKDVRRIGRLVDWLRFEANLNYDQQFAIAHKLTDIEPADWDQLLFDADMLDLAGTQN